MHKSEKLTEELGQLFSSLGGITVSNYMNVYGGSYAHVFKLISGSTFGVAAVIALASRVFDHYLGQYFDITKCENGKEAWKMLAKREFASLAGTIFFGSCVGGVLAIITATGSSAVVSVAAMAALIWFTTKLIDAQLFFLQSSMLSVKDSDFNYVNNAIALTLGVERKFLRSEEKVSGKEWLLGRIEVKNLILNDSKVYVGCVDEKNRVDQFQCYKEKTLGDAMVRNIDNMIKNHDLLSVDPYENLDDMAKRKYKICRLLSNKPVLYSELVKASKEKLQKLKGVWEHLSASQVK